MLQPCNLNAQGFFVHFSFLNRSMSVIMLSIGLMMLLLYLYKSNLLVQKKNISHTDSR